MEPGGTSEVRGKELKKVDLEGSARLKVEERHVQIQSHQVGNAPGP